MFFFLKGDIWYLFRLSSMEVAVAELDSFDIAKGNERNRYTRNNDFSFLSIEK